MPVYAIIELQVRDERIYGEYAAGVRGIVEAHGGRYLVRGGKATPLGGGWAPERMVVIEFPSAEHAARCFDSPAYREIAPLRERSTVSRAVVVEGCA